jgi:TonB family protein
MTQPQRLSGPDPAYTMEALEHEVEGVLEVQCVVSTSGEVRDCQVRKSVPFMDGAVVQALERRRYSPARLSNGEAIEVQYLFRVRLQLP